MKILMALLVTAFIGCGMSNDATSERFAEGQAMICVDEVDGSKWAISHHVGNVFTVKPIQP